jgi:hypothetical protein
MDLRPNFQAKAEDRARKQHEWLTETLSTAVAQMRWKVQTVIFTGGTMGSVKIDRFEQNLATLEVKKKVWTTIRRMHARALLEAQDTVLRACQSIARGPGYSFASILRCNIRKSHPGDTA